MRRGAALEALSHCGTLALATLNLEWCRQSSWSAACCGCARTGEQPLIGNSESL
jgi:hypothetical protein